MRFCILYFFVNFVDIHHGLPPFHQSDHSNFKFTDMAGGCMLPFTVKVFAGWEEEHEQPTKLILRFEHFNIITWDWLCFIFGPFCTVDSRSQKCILSLKHRQYLERKVKLLKYVVTGNYAILMCNWMEIPFFTDVISKTVCISLWSRGSDYNSDYQGSD